MVFAKTQKTGEGLDDQDLHREVLNGPDGTKGGPIDSRKESGRIEIPRLRGVARAEGSIKIGRLTTLARLNGRDRAGKGWVRSSQEIRLESDLDPLSKVDLGFEQS